MATEMVEYRPGKWVKVVDGRIVGRATPEEVAAWLRESGRSTASPASLMLDVDLGPPSGPGVEPSRMLDVPLRPAFERRGRSVPVAGPTAGLRVVAPNADAPKVDTPAATNRDIGHMTRNTPYAVRITPEVAPLPKSETEPRAKPATPPITTRRLAKAPKPVATTHKPHVEADAPEPPAPIAEAPRSQADAPSTPAAEQAEDSERRPAGGGPSYWWICNVHRQPAESFLKEWLPKYKAKFGHEATLVLCHEDDLSAAQACGLDADTSPLLRPGHFYLGHSNGEDSQGHQKRQGARASESG